MRFPSAVDSCHSDDVQEWLTILPASGTEVEPLLDTFLGELGVVVVISCVGIIIVFLFLFVFYTFNCKPPRLIGHQETYRLLVNTQLSPSLYITRASIEDNFGLPQ